MVNRRLIVTICAISATFIVGLSLIPFKMSALASDIQVTTTVTNQKYAAKPDQKAILIPTTITNTPTPTPRPTNTPTPRPTNTPTPTPIPNIITDNTEATAGTNIVIPESTTPSIESVTTEPSVNGPMEDHLTAYGGVFNGPSGRETYYNLNMTNIINFMRDLGYDETNYPYWIREDGCKMLGPYIMVAANFEIRPRGTILETSLGTAIVVDTGDFVNTYPEGIDIAVNW